jgi:hypothetical protein
MPDCLCRPSESTSFTNPEVNSSAPLMAPSAGIRTNEALCQLIYKAPYLGVKEVDSLGLHRQSGIHAQEN